MTQTNNHSRPFLCSYGGGHAQILLAVCEELNARGADYDLMGFTTAHATFETAGLSPLDAGALLPRSEAEAIIDALGAQIPVADHPDITQQQTDNYFAAGFADLVERFGRDEARAKVDQFGRKAFEPVSVFERYFRELKPSVIVSTTSPRFELAALKAGRNLGIPTIAIGDMYLIAEQEWILDEPYAEHLTVISSEVADMLTGAGLRDTRLHVLGNPAFDALRTSPGDEDKRSRLRTQLGFDSKEVILWPLGGSSELVAGRRMLGADEVRDLLDRFCEQNPEFRYIMRPHPNWPVTPIESEYGVLDSALTPEEALLVADVVCVEASTLGLQAVLKGKPTICLNFADYVIYPDYGWALSANSVDQMFDQLSSRSYFPAPAELQATVGSASAALVDLIEQVAMRTAENRPTD